MAALSSSPTVPRRLEWAAACRALPGQTNSGDLHLIVEGPWGSLAAVIDGLGHGDEAMAAAQAAAAILRQRAGEPVVALIRHCHEALKHTRGAVMTLVEFRASDGTVNAVGIGNVEAVLLRANVLAEPRSENILLRAGLVGYQLPTLQPSLLDVRHGDVVVFATDGVRGGFVQGLSAAQTLKDMTDQVMKTHFRGTDDGMVLAVRYRGGDRRG